VSWVVAQLAGGIGDLPVEAVVTFAQSGAEILRIGPKTVEFPVSRLRPVTVVLRGSGLEFPFPGVYLVEMLCAGRFIDDARLYVIPKRGDFP